MTIRNPPLSEVGALVTLPQIRRLATAFVRSPGLRSKTDLQVSGDPSAMKVNLTLGDYFFMLPDGTLDVLSSNATESRNLATAPGSGTRTDLVYAGYKSKEFGDASSAMDLYVKTGDTSGAIPAPDVMAATGALAKVQVPAGATRGSDCTITQLAATAAPTRDGGYGASDLVLPTQPYLAWHRTGIGAGGAIIAHNACPFTPQFVSAVGVFPHSGAYRPSVFQPDLATFTTGGFHGWWYGPDGAPLVVDPGIGYFEFVAIMWPGPALTPPS